MNCEQARERLAEDLHAAPLPEDLEVHLQGCTACQRHHAELQQLGHVLDQWASREDPIDVRTLPSPRRPLHRRPLVVGLAAGLTLFLGLLALGVRVDAHARGVSIHLGQAPEPAPAGDLPAQVADAVQHRLWQALETIDHQLVAADERHEQRFQSLWKGLVTLREQQLRGDVGVLEAVAWNDQRRHVP